MIQIEGTDYQFKQLHRYVNIAKAMLDKPNSGFLHFTFITDKSRIISFGYNDITYAGIKIRNKLVFYPLGGVHSEARALKNARGDFSKLTVINIRLNKRGELRCSKPCKICAKLLRDFGLGNLYYSTNLGFEFENLKK